MGEGDTRGTWGRGHLGEEWKENKAKRLENKW